MLAAGCRQKAETMGTNVTAFRHNATMPDVEFNTTIDGYVEGSMPKQIPKYNATRSIFTYVFIYRQEQTGCRSRAFAKSAQLRLQLQSLKSSVHRLPVFTVLCAVKLCNG
jgi:hypothetical protein